MRVIHQLPQSVVSKIAAGEVIERPVYAVKELIENALDAGATSITIQLEESGLKRITIIDNGQGMSPEDLAEAYKPHTTSKLREEDDLSHIRTLGFRGEALSSIAEISHLTIASRTKSASGGTSITIKEGKAEEATAFGMPVGTIIIVRGLFHSVPGRKKFLRSSRTELRHITEYVTRVALMHPQVHFSLTHNNRVLFDVSPTTDVPERIRLLLGERVFTTLLPVTFELNNVIISGFLTRPQASGAHSQYLSLNKRSITDKIINAAIKSAYGTLLEQTVYPTYMLEVSLPWEYVDVNVHPRKETVRFMNQQTVYDTVFQAVKQVLAQYSLGHQAHEMSVGDASEASYGRKGQLGSYAGRLLREKRVPWSIETVSELKGTNAIQMHDLYLVTETMFGIVLVDQHAAHERILYEQLLAEFQKQQKEQAQYVFSKPLLISVGVTDSLALQEYLPLFQEIGFDLEHFKDTTFRLRSVPMLFHDRKHEDLLMEMLAEMREPKLATGLDKVSHKMIAYLACRGAVKAGDSLTKKQIKELLEKLAQTSNNATCPHGRPTRVEIPLTKLHKLFKRK